MQAILVRVVFNVTRLEKILLLNILLSVELKLFRHSTLGQPTNQMAC